MKIRKHTGYYSCSNLIFYYLEERIISYAVFIKDAYNRFTIAPHSESTIKAQPNKRFRVYHNFYIESYSESDALVGFYLI